MNLKLPQNGHQFISLVHFIGYSASLSTPHVLNLNVKMSSQVQPDRRTLLATGAALTNLVLPDSFFAPEGQRFLPDDLQLRAALDALQNMLPSDLASVRVRNFPSDAQVMHLAIKMVHPTALKKMDDATKEYVKRVQSQVEDLLILLGKHLNLREIYLDAATKEKLRICTEYAELMQLPEQERESMLATRSLARSIQALSRDAFRGRGPKTSNPLVDRLIDAYSARLDNQFEQELLTGEALALSAPIKLFTEGKLKIRISEDKLATEPVKKVLVRAQRGGFHSTEEFVQQFLAENDKRQQRVLDRYISSSPDKIVVSVYGIADDFLNNVQSRNADSRNPKMLLVDIIPTEIIVDEQVKTLTR